MHSAVFNLLCGSFFSSSSSPSSHFTPPHPPPSLSISPLFAGPTAAVASGKESSSAPSITTSRRDGKYTWQEVASHNTAESAWVIVDGRVYDITDFIPTHPGGSEMLLLAAGRECTDLFNSYHWKAPEKARKYLVNYEIGKLVGPTEYPVFAPDTTGFYATLSERVKKHFEETKKNPKTKIPGAWRLAVQIAVGLSMFLVSVGYVNPLTMEYGPGVGNVLPLWARFAAAAIYGIFQVMPLLHAMHDASHTAIGTTQTSWKFFGRLTLDWYAGASMLSWHHQHIVGHHVYTNIFMADPDIPYR